MTGLVASNAGEIAFLISDDTSLTTFAGMAERTHAEWKALLDWCKLHGLDPMRMPACQTIVRNLERCRVEYDEAVLDERGRGQFDPDTHELVRRRVHVQGETPPVPFPAVTLRWLVV